MKIIMIIVLVRISLFFLFVPVVLCCRCRQDVRGPLETASCVFAHTFTHCLSLYFPEALQQSHHLQGGHTGSLSVALTKAGSMSQWANM